MKRILATMLFSIATIYAVDAHADIVFPAIANQFAVTFVIGFYWSILIALLILVIETFFIKKLLNLNIFPTIVFSFGVNLLSSIAGVLIASFAVHGKNIFAYGNMRFGTYLGMIPGYGFSVLIEGLLLIVCASLLKRSVSLSNCLKISASMNLCSYMLLLLSIFIADFVSKGQVFNIH